jgi:hypothetical protein
MSSKQLKKNRKISSKIISTGVGDYIMKKFIQKRLISQLPEKSMRLTFLALYS